jgi:hypothetical protein
VEEEEEDLGDGEDAAVEEEEDDEEDVLLVLLFVLLLDDELFELEVEEEQEEEYVEEESHDLERSSAASRLRYASNCGETRSSASAQLSSYEKPGRCSRGKTAPAPAEEAASAAIAGRIFAMWAATAADEKNRRDNIALESRSRYTTMKYQNQIRNWKSENERRENKRKRKETIKKQRGKKRENSEKERLLENRDKLSQSSQQQTLSCSLLYDSYLACVVTKMGTAQLRKKILYD